VPPAFAGALVYVVNDALYAIDSGSGEARWRVPLAHPPSNAPSVAGGMVYVGDGDEVVAVGALDGHIAWRMSVGAGIQSPITPGDDAAYVIAGDTLVALGP
jgi:outer membrane protein assembly factor BamB